MSKLPLPSVNCEATKLLLESKTIDFPAVQAGVARVERAIAVQVVVDLAGDAARVVAAAV